MDGEVHVGEFVLGGKDQGMTGRCYDGKKKTDITAVQLTEDGKAKRMCATKIEDFSAQSLQYILVKQIDRETKVITYKWMGYKSIVKAYNSAPIEGDKRIKFQSTT